MSAFRDLASCLKIPIELLERHLVQPLAPPLVDFTTEITLLIPSQYRELLEISDGVDFFGRQPWECFRLSGSGDYDLEFLQQETEIGVFPIYGEWPHVTSLNISDGSIIATDWEVEGEPGTWRQLIAKDISEFVRTVIAVREAYGFDPDGMPAHWWEPYASTGYRFDLEESKRNSDATTAPDQKTDR